MSLIIQGQIERLIRRHRQGEIRHLDPNFNQNVFIEVEQEDFRLLDEMLWEKSRGMYKPENKFILDYNGYKIIPSLLVKRNEPELIIKTLKQCY